MTSTEVAFQEMESHLLVSFNLFDQSMDCCMSSYIIEVLYHPACYISGSDPKKWGSMA